MKIRDSAFNKTPETHSALSSTGYTGETMRKDSDLSPMNNFEKYFIHTAVGYEPSERKICLLTELPK